MDSQNKRPIAPDYIAPESTGAESIGQLAGEHHRKKQALVRLVTTLDGAAQRRANQNGERTDVQPPVPDSVLLGGNSAGDSSPSDNGTDNGTSLKEVADSQASTNSLQPGRADMPPEQYQQAIKGDLEAQEALARAGLINQGNIGQLYDDIMSCYQRHQGKGSVSLRICPEAEVTKYWRAVASDQAFGLSQRVDEEEADKANNGVNSATGDSGGVDNTAHDTDDISSIDLDVVAGQLHELGVISHHDELSKLLTAGLPNDTFRLAASQMHVSESYRSILSSIVVNIPGMPEIVERLTPRQLSYCRFYKTYHEEFPELNWMPLWEFGERGPTGKYWLEALAGGDEELYDAYLRDHSDNPADPINIIEALRLAGQLDDPDAISIIERVIDTPDIPPESLRRLGATLTQLQDKFPLITDPDSYAQLLQLCLKGGDQALGDDYLGHVAFYNTYAIDNLLEMDPDQLHNVRRHLDMLTGLDLMPYDRARLTNLAVLTEGKESSCRLFDQLCQVEELSLDDDTRASLVALMRSRNKWDISTLEELENYDAVVSERIGYGLIDDSDYMYQAVESMLDPASRPFQIDSFNWEELEQEDILDDDDRATIRLARVMSEGWLENDEILDAIQQSGLFVPVAGESGRAEVTKLDGALARLYDKAYRYITDDWNQAMFDVNSYGEGIEHTTVEDAQGNLIKVTKLVGAPFNILSHTIFSYNMKGIFRELMKDPSVWNRAMGTSTISTSCIGDKYLNYVTGRHHDEVALGFSQINPGALIGMNYRDGWMEHGRGVFYPSMMHGRTSMTTCQRFMDDCAKWRNEDGYKWKHVYNEVGLLRISGDPAVHHGRLQPSCIIVHGSDVGDISDSHKRFARGFKVPILLIDDDKYKKKEVHEQGKA
ncbi:hypothetical protein [Candidatus Nanoperiomorbus periodonticus]|uniref:hypothetical protein n=1 Tax=Candidatus Nanoperiomorbus periodonticus TaxID=2171989 RepID=UPI00101D95CD|nr:hypothetical protein [Candidatus Nanoperiomorbus periodonticus]RYC76220.1 hypothetical protein G51EAM_00360 [Candidatus Nanoperiomorbus periodonticus]